MTALLKSLHSAFSILMIRSFFNHDSSTIITAEGKKVLKDRKRMDNLQAQIEAQNTSKKYSDIHI